VSYLSATELLNWITTAELVQLTDDKKSGVVDAAKIAAALEAADSEIDSYAGVRFSLPLPTSTRIKQLAASIAIFRLEERRRRIRKDTQEGYDRALVFLRDLAAGRATLDQPAGVPPQIGAQEVLSSEEEDLKFSDGNLDGF